MNFKKQWFGNIRSDLLAGTVVALALIPEAIAFSIIAGVDPKVGLYASISIAILISFIGGRVGMISAATGAMALIMVNLVKDFGLEYLLAATILAGLIQFIAGMLRVGAIIDFVSRSVITGFTNSLAILIFLAQLPEFYSGNTEMYILVIVGLLIIYTLPYLTSIFPSPLVCIVLLTSIVFFLDLDVRTVSDMGDLPSTLPSFLIPNVPISFDTLLIILPYSLALAAVGLLETLLTATVVDEMTDTESDKNKECRGQGIANIFTGFFGGMAGCAMIGQSVANIKSGGNGRLSTLSAGVILLLLLVTLSELLRLIPMAALVAIMIMVSISTFNWNSIVNLKKHPKHSSFVMICTVLVVLYSHNLALGVLTGVLLSSLYFAKKVAMYQKVDLINKSNTSEYKIKGQVFFASANKFMKSFKFDDKIKNVNIDVSEAHFWDLSAVAALDRVVDKYRKKNITTNVIGLNLASKTIVTKLSEVEKKNIDII
ncbi:SulP family inorganic anion transporter [Alphaproteobacteria bacterium]|nr:SulP family inorganic anion transporter [Alphaproteobacteria bacterium]